MKIKYSDTVEYYFNMKFNELIIPDIIVVKEGISCGDKIQLSLQLDENTLHFDFSCDNCCILCKSACNYIEKNFNHKDFTFIKREISKIVKISNLNETYLFDLFNLDCNKYCMRKDCIFSPFEFFLDSLIKLKDTHHTYHIKPDTYSTLACDACVGACRINWEQKEVPKFDHHSSKTYSLEYLKNWIPLGKVELSNEEINRLRINCSNISDKDLQFLSDFTMNGFILDHLLKYFPDIVDKKWKGAAYLIQKNEINKAHFEKVKDYIRDNKLDIYSVKGYVTQKYYENPMIRVHSDYDLIATSSNDAFKLANYLLKNGFTIRPNLFSYKKMNYGGKELISGHFHVQKIVDDMYMLELDITFPAFPINRVDLFVPKVRENNISIEGQIIITLLHLFKHEHIYIKDINDIFYMLKEQIDFDYLLSLIKEYKLEKFFNITLSYINNNYKTFNNYYKLISSRFNFDDNILEKYPEWPYDLDMHLRIKREDLNERLKLSKESDRKYLFPIAIFKNFIDLGKFKNKIDGYSVNYVETSIYEIIYNDYIFYLTPIGIFIDNYVDTKIKNREEYVKIIKNFLDKMNIYDKYNITYAYSHFYVRII